MMVGKGNEGVQGRLMAAYTLINNAIWLHFLLNLVFYFLFFVEADSNWNSSPSGVGNICPSRVFSLHFLFFFFFVWFLQVSAPFAFLPSIEMVHAGRKVGRDGGKKVQGEEENITCFLSPSWSFHVTLTSYLPPHYPLFTFFIQLGTEFLSSFGLVDSLTPYWIIGH